MRSTFNEDRIVTNVRSPRSNNNFFVDRFTIPWYRLVDRVTPILRREISWTILYSLVTECHSSEFYRSPLKGSERRRVPVSTRSILIDRASTIPINPFPRIGDRFTFQGPRKFERIDRPSIDNYDRGISFIPFTEKEKMTIIGSSVSSWMLGNQHSDSAMTKSNRRVFLSFVLSILTRVRPTLLRSIQVSLDTFHTVFASSDSIIGIRDVVNGIIDRGNLLSGFDDSHNQSALRTIIYAFLASMKNTLGYIHIAHNRKIRVIPTYIQT